MKKYCDEHLQNGSCIHSTWNQPCIKPYPIPDGWPNAFDVEKAEVWIESFPTVSKRWLEWAIAQLKAERAARE